MFCSDLTAHMGNWATEIGPHALNIPTAVFNDRCCQIVHLLLLRSRLVSEYNVWFTLHLVPKFKKTLEPVLSTPYHSLHSTRLLGGSYTRTCVLLNNNDILLHTFLCFPCQWESINELNKLPNLEDLRFRENPVLETESAETSRQLIIARIGNIKVTEN